MHGEQLRSVKRTPKRYVGARDKRTVPEATSLTELVRGVLYGPRLLSCQLSAADCRVMSCNDFTTSRLARTQIEPPGSRSARLMPSLLPARRQGTYALQVAADS